MKRTVPIVAILGLLLVSCGGGSDSAGQPAATQPTAPPPTEGATTPGSDTATTTAPEPVRRLVPEVLSVRPHDAGAWTQGLIMFGERMFESTGATPDIATLREVDPQTGEVLRLITVEPPLYAEGLERVDDRLIQLTWQNEVAFEYDLETFRQIRSIPYAGEGWGLCRNDTSLVMSDGSDQLQFRDPISFDEVAPRVSVTLDGGPVGQLNELECVDGFVWANIWLTDSIVQIDPADGAVTAVVDASGLERPDEADVLNGIAYDPAAESYLLTGKLWPAMYEVRFVPA